MIEIIYWVVSPGNKKGRTIWFPTINISLKSDSLLSWTYKIRALLEWNYYTWVWVYFHERELFEAHLFSYEWDCYWKKITIVPTVFLRENKKFTSHQELQKAISQDCKKAKEIKTTVMTFWTFDHFHEWHTYYLWTAKLYWDVLVTIVARDATVKTVKSLTPTHSEDERVQAVKASWIVTNAVLWDTTDYYTCLHDWTPSVICLWYDQHSFDKGIIQRYKEKSLPIPHIVRLKPHREREFKSSFYR